MEFQGHFSANEAANFSKAIETWKLSAEQGHGQSAWALMLLHLRGDLGTGDLRELTPFLQTINASSDAPDDQKAFATHLQYRHGLGVDADAAQAGLWLEKSAELGGLNAQLMMAEAYAGRIAFSNLTSQGLIPCISRLPIVGDRVQPLNGKLDADEGPNAWRLSPGEV